MNDTGIMKSFKAYDIRGKVPDDLDAELCSHLGLALASEFSPKRVAIGRDVRPSGVELSAALTDALVSSGIAVTDIGLCGTEEMYYAAATQGFDIGVVFTASHNPAEYNGIKLVRRGAVPISGDSGLFAVRDRILQKRYTSGSGPNGVRIEQSFRADYIQFLLSQAYLHTQKPMKIVMNPGNGCAGYVLRELLPHLPGDFILVQEEPDGTFPNGIPNPLLPERRQDTADAVRRYRADLGIAWDGDFDRCFFYDADGNFIESYYLIGLLAQNLLKKHPGGTILHDPRLVWNTVEMVREAGGLPIETKTGHAFMKERMRSENAVYGGEMSAHHYFRDFSYCDSGMLPWLMLLHILGAADAGLAELVATRVKAYPCSGEINFRVSDAAAATAAIHAKFKNSIIGESHIDGLSADCGEWRFNIRSSNTEPLLRLNVESRGNIALVQEQVATITTILQALEGDMLHE